MGYDRIVYIRYHFSCGLDRKDACWLSFTPLTGADQQVRSPSSRQVFLSSEGSMASFHEISSIDSSSSVLDSVQKLLAVQLLNNFGWFSWLPCTKFVSSMLVVYGVLDLLSTAAASLSCNVKPRCRDRIFYQMKAEAWNFPALNLGKDGQEGFKN